MPARSSARAKACEPCTSAKISLPSKCRDPENCSKTSDGPDSKRPPQSFIALLFQRSLDFDGEPDYVDETKGIFLVVACAHGEAGDIEVVERIGALAADRFDVALEEAEGDV